jgi:dTDP-4-dehydrorhamnose 3,5-epimerase/CDP-3, 6-dideoxy-D-glycero-D-glycero-4-hexulose-5-epimerase
MYFKINKTKFKNVFIIYPKNYNDSRGSFIKIFSQNIFNKLKLQSSLKEVYITHSKKNVIRGMHYQISPFKLVKIIKVIRGEILDVILCLDKKSKDYGKSYSVKLSDANNKILYIPENYAHGFRVLSKEAIVCYLTSNSYNFKSDKCISYKSFGFNWKCRNPILSKRDLKGKKFEKNN